MNETLSVREIEFKDIDLICHYWLNATSEHLLFMGVDLLKLPSASEFQDLLLKQLNSNYEDKHSYAVIWLSNNIPIGHSNVNQIKFKESAFMHLHLWESENRKHGIGSELVKKSLPFYFENLHLKELLCEPYALNPAPNKTLEKVGFTFVKSHFTIPSPLNFYQEVNRWSLTKEEYEKILI